MSESRNIKWINSKKCCKSTNSLEQINLFVLVVFNVLEHQSRVVVGSHLCVVLPLNLNSAHCHIVDSNLTVECVVSHPSSHCLVQTKFFQFVGSQEVTNFLVGFYSWGYELVHDRVTHGLDFVFREVDKERSTSDHEANEGHDSVLVVLLIHEVGFVFGVLFDFLITQSSNIYSKFLM